MNNDRERIDLLIKNARWLPGLNSLKRAFIGSPSTDRSVGFISNFKNYVTRAVKGDTSVARSSSKPASASRSFVNSVSKKGKNDKSTLLDRFAKNKGPLTAIESGKGKEYVGRVNVSKANAKMGIASSLRESLGNTAHVMQQIGANTKGKGFFGGATQVIKNIGHQATSDLKRDLFMEVGKGRGKVLTSSTGKKTFQDKTIFGNLRTREMVGDTNRDTVLLKQRKRYMPVSVALGGSGIAVAGGSYALSDKEESKRRRGSQALVEGAAWGLSGPLGMATSLTIGSRIEKRRNKREEKKNLNNQTRSV